jgi:aminopeptidase N
VLHRIETGGTEFPMMQMNGSPSQSLVLHEGGHIYTYGLLANNEWQSGWMDEGLTSYQTDWALGEARHVLALDGGRTVVGPQPSAAELLRRRREADATTRAQESFVRGGRAEPMGTRADRFANFGVYNFTVYARGSQFYSALRDVLGEAPFAAFLRDYYARWALRHVDEAAMRGSAERACQAAGACDLGWFFDQWVRGVGYVDYTLRDVVTTPAAGGFVTTATLARAGAYRHPMPVGVRTDAGWTVVRGDPRRDVQRVEIRTAARPGEVRLDPYGTTEAWSARYYVWPRSARDLAAPSTGRAPAAAAGASR